MPLLFLSTGCLQQVSARQRSQPSAPPLPIVDVFGDGTLRTAGVNRFTCRARVGAVEWLGTLQGLKRLDTKTKAVRYLTRRDGLPGDYIEAVVADEKGVYALVRDAQNPFHVFLGTLNPTTLRWKTLAQSTTRPYSGASWSLALSPTQLVLAPPAVAWHQDTFLTVLERGTQRVRSIPWDEALRADHERVTISFLTLRKGVAWLGTDLGLLSVPLSGTPLWKRTLPEQSCAAGSWSATGTLWLLTHARTQPLELFVREWNPTDQRLVHEAKVPPKPTESTFPTRRGFEPVLTVTGNEVWLTRTEEGLLRYDPKAKAWQIAALLTPGSPEAAVLPYVLTRIPPIPPEQMAEVRFPATPDYWLSRRFPDWLTGSPDPLASRTVPIEDWPRFGRLIDSENPELVWGSAENALLLMEKGDVPAIFRGPDQSTFGTASFSREKAQNFPASLAKKSVALPLGMLAPYGQNELVALTGQGLFQTKGSALQKLVGGTDFGNNQAAVAGPNGSVFVRTGEGMRRWDSETQKAIAVDIPDTTRYSLKAGTPLGLLFQESHSVLWLQELDAQDKPKGALKRIELPGAVFQAAVGNTLWCLRGSQDWAGYNLTTGRWSTPLKLTNSGYTGGNPFLNLRGQVYFVSESKEGALLRYNETQDRWDALVPEVPERRSQGLSLAALTDDEALFADRLQAWRYDRRKEKWSAIELPEAVRLNASAPFTRCSALGTDGFYLGGEKGLWRYRPTERRWEEIRATLSEGEGQKLYLHLRSVDSSAVWGEVQSNGNPAPRWVFRFDKKTHQFRYFDEAAGVPSAYAFQNIADGAGYWFMTNEGAWRLDSQSGKATQLTTEAMQAIQPDPYDPNRVYLLSRQGVLFAYDKRTQQCQTLSGPALQHGTALLVEREHVLVCADTHLFAVQKASGVWKPVTLPADQPPITAFRIKRKDDVTLLLSDYDGQNQIEVKL